MTSPMGRSTSGSPTSGGSTPGSPNELAEACKRYWDQQWALWSAFSNGGGPPVISPAPTDHRFQDRDWSEHPWYSALKQAYLLNARLLSAMVEAADLDDKSHHAVRFFAQQFIDATSPANFAATNPAAMKLALESNGASLRAGFVNLMDDLKRGRIAITDESAFEVGRNVATSEGAVVFECELMQLIQYAPLTDKVAARPLLIVPPCVNKFYILDLQPGNSFVRHAREQGHTVFLISWRNPDDALQHTTWDDYLRQGVIQAIEIALSVSGADKVNAVGWCIGGTMLSSALAVQRARGVDTVASMTLLTTQLDFAEPGDLGAFVDEPGVRQRESALGGGGVFNGKELAFVFQMLRANDLLWPYVIDNYLLGKTPAAFDLLYWNADATNLPGPMYAWLLRHLYLENSLCVPGKLEMCGHAVDLGRIDMPGYVLATQSDHLVPWRSAYRTTQLLGGGPQRAQSVQFVLAASGHIAGVINPPSANKRNFWTGEGCPRDADEWFSQAQASPGSWWTHWRDWLRAYSGGTVPAPRAPGNATYAPIEPAPGRYVMVRCD